jgi:REP element-mobilizing transposase RayT
MDIFTCDYERNVFVGKLGMLLQQYNCICYAWCLMPNHFHLVIRPIDIKLESLMRRLNGFYARFFNHRHGRRGYLFQDRYKSIATQGSVYTRELVRYVHLNPLRAGLVSSLDELSDYRWSGHRSILGIEKCPWMAIKEIRSRFSPDLKRAQKVYRAFLEEGIDRRGSFDSIWDEIRAVTRVSGGDSRFGDGRVAGEPAYVEKMIARTEREESRLRKVRANRPSLSSLSTKFCKKFRLSEPSELFRCRKDGRRSMREEFCYTAYKRYGYRLSEIAAFIGIQPESVYRLANVWGKK